MRFPRRLSPFHCLAGFGLVFLLWCAIDSGKNTSVWSHSAKDLKERWSLGHGDYGLVYNHEKIDGSTLMLGSSEGLLPGRMPMPATKPFWRGPEMLETDREIPFMECHSHEYMVSIPYSSIIAAYLLLWGAAAFVRWKSRQRARRRASAMEMQLG